MDIRPRRQELLEWWFVQGRVGAAETEPLDFMLSVFRHRVDVGHGSDGFMLLASTFDHASGQHHVRSEVSGAFVDNFLEEAPGKLEKAGVDPRVVAAFLDEIRQAGAPLPVRTSGDSVSLSDAPFAFRWGDVQLDQTGEAIALAFDLPGGLGRLQLSGNPQTGWLDEDSIGQHDGRGGMGYQSCPRLSLGGSLDGRAVTGQGWIDHQWGDYGWLKSDAGAGAILGWEWFGINLDDGRDLLVTVRRDMKSGETLSSFAAWFDGAASPRIVQDIGLSPLRRWTSTRTMTAYPLEWHIEIPSLELALDFAPVVDAQEVPVFGVSNVIWEGVGTVSGAIGGRSASGRARLELNGYGFVLDSEDRQQAWVERIDRTLLAFLPEKLTEARLAAYAGTARWRYDAQSQTEMFARPVWDLMARGGKHWRPVYGFLLLEAFGVDPAPYEGLISIVPELVHNGSLIIDDIQDRSETRRGEPAIHSRYGIATAINAGNMLYFLPLLELAEHKALDAVQRDAIYRVVMRMFVRGHLGQGQDLHMSEARKPGFWQRPELGELILQTHAFKTAAAVAAVSEVAAIIARTDEATRQSCIRFGESWGVAFQIIDDVNNFTSDPGWGKLRGEDLVAGKASYAIWKAVTMLALPDRDRLIAILNDPQLRATNAGHSEGIALVERSGALAACMAEAKQLAESDWPSFRATLPHSQARIMLRLFVSNLTGLSLDL